MTLDNFSSRVTLDSTFTDTIVAPDSTYDSIGGFWQVLEDTSLVTDTVTYRSRKKYAKIQHSPTVYLPTISLGNYVNVVPRISYRETWIEIFRTDQSEEAGIEPGHYRTYSWGAGVSANTRLYGTVYPNVWRLMGLRHVLGPSVAYSYTPDIDRHPDVRKYAGGGAGSRKSSAVSFSLAQDVQGKIRSGETERSLDLLSLNSGFSYNFEEDDRPFSDIATTYRSQAIPNVSINGKITHSLYEPETDADTARLWSPYSQSGGGNLPRLLTEHEPERNKLNFWWPSRQSFSFNASIRLNGLFPLFDEPVTVPRAQDSASQVPEDEPTVAGKAKAGTWTCNLAYTYSESGRGNSFRKNSTFFVDVRMGFNVTPSTTVSYTQRYDFMEGRTMNNSVSIVRNIHCWTGSLSWVPNGSNRGFWFKLHVTDLPEVKIDNGRDDFLNGLRRYR